MSLRVPCRWVWTPRAAVPSRHLIATWGANGLTGATRRNYELFLVKKDGFGAFNILSATAGNLMFVNFSSG